MRNPIEALSTFLLRRSASHTPWLFPFPQHLGFKEKKKNTNNQREKKRRAGEVGERIWSSNFHDIKYCNIVKKKKKKKKRNDKARRS